MRLTEQNSQCKPPTVVYSRQPGRLLSVLLREKGKAKKKRKRSAVYRRFVVEKRCGRWRCYAPEQLVRINKKKTVWFTAPTLAFVAGRGGKERSSTAADEGAKKRKGKGLEIVVGVKWY